MRERAEHPPAVRPLSAEEREAQGIVRATLYFATSSLGFVCCLYQPTPLVISLACTLAALAIVYANRIKK